MLGKLTKHEIVATSRMLIPMYIALLVTSVIGKFFIWLTSKQAFIDAVPTSFATIVTFLSSLLTILYGVLIAAVLIATILFIILRFYKNLFTDEGYLMFTLPVKTHSLLLSKLFSALLWTLISIIVVFASLMVILYSGELAETLKNFWDAAMKFIEQQGDTFKADYNVSIPGLIVELICLLIIALIGNYLMFYAAIAIGPKISSKNKIIGGVVGYLLLYIGSQIVSGILMFLLFTVIPNYFEGLSQNRGDAIQSTILSTGSLNIVFCGVYFFLANFFMKKKLNLD